MELDYSNLIEKGQTKQISLFEEGSISLSPLYKYRIGLSLAEKDYMTLGNPEENNQIQIKINYKKSQHNENKNNIIELGKTQRYESEVSGVESLTFPHGFSPYNLILQITCLGSEGIINEQ